MNTIQSSILKTIVLLSVLSSTISPSISSPSGLENPQTWRTRRDTLISQNGQYNNPSPTSYYAQNQPGQPISTHPFSADFIAKAGERVAERLRDHADQSNQGTNPALESTIQAALISGGAAGIDQAGHGDCWLEAALAALARIPEGQQLLANMITQDSSSSYFVSFPGVRRSMHINVNEITQEKTRDMAPWACIIEAAAIKGWPNLVTEGKQQFSPYSRRPTLIMGLRVLTGNRVQCVRLSQCSPPMIGKLIDNALARHMPITAATYPMARQGRIPQVVVPSHVYTIIAYDPSNRIITLRNPWGKNSTPKNKERLPDLPEVGQEAAGVYDMGGGLVKMSLPTFRQHYRYLAWAAI
jgi:hypothetical protein